jgi:chromosome segregation ATPase
MSGDSTGALEVPLDAETFEARVHHRVTEYGQRHQQRERVMMSYDKVSGSEPGLGRFADPRKVQVELNDELDREQISEELSGDYSEQAHEVQAKAKALQDFIAKRRQTLDDLNKHNGGNHRQDLEVALANLARQPLSPETMGAMREIDRRLAETERDEKDLPSRLGQNQQEATDAVEELTKLQALQQAYEKEAKMYSADALAAHQNRQRLAGRLEYYVVRSQAEDELDQGRKAIEAAEHLPASPQMESMLTGGAQTTRSDADLQQLRDCIRDSGDVKSCRALMHQE